MEVNVTTPQSASGVPNGAGTVPQSYEAAGSTSTTNASSSTGQMTDTAKEQAHKVAGDVKAQARNVASDMRQQVSQQARKQSNNMADAIRRAADELDQMAANRGDSPARSLVTRVADGGRQFADYLSQHGPEGILGEVQDFARRRPGAFLATALVSGFVVGRLGKAVLSGQSDSGSGSGSTYGSEYQPSYGYGYGAEQATQPIPTAPVATPVPDPILSPAYDPARTGTEMPVPGSYPADRPVYADQGSVTDGGQRP